MLSIDTGSGASDTSECISHTRGLFFISQCISDHHGNL